MLNNRICELLGIRFPIIQAPMNWVSGAELVAAVSNAGGLGTLGPNAGSKDITADAEETGERFRARIREIKRLTKAPFAVNITVGFGEEQLKYSRKTVAVAIEENVPAAVVSVGSPGVYTETLKDAGIKVMHAVSTATHAAKAEAAGVDAVICEGFEAGGHKGFTELTTLVLTPMVADAVNIPVISGGGIGDARGALAILALGADGIYMGTRFMATREAASHERVKTAIVEGTDVCTVSLPKAHMLARDLSNQFTETYLRMKSEGAAMETLEQYLGGHGQYHSQFLGEAEEAEICCGQVAALIDQVATAGDVVTDIVNGLGREIEALSTRLSGL